ncbi:hypothetical protein B0A48_12461 [Cryoendolithus antarcticus]|uniref:Uncharacterized protein n=1 Tax=Cryoendolithus antarcticus TaxID=1507870 RepID=A0A1V8SSJ3_9PEZI|nr:hypothetical protein B0A48_12461 [Cryoendolithus antarcticus]
MVAKSPGSILDIGCGSGIWAADIATRYPDAEVTGVDIVGGQPDHGAPNLRWKTPDHGGSGFDLEDAQWNFPLNSFDLIHVGHLCGAVPDWSRFFAKVYRHLRYDGNFEQFEIDYEPRYDDGAEIANPRLFDWWKRMQLALPDKPITCPNIGESLHHAGFVDIQHKPYRLPLASAENDMLSYATLVNSAHEDKTASSFHGLTMGPFTRHLHWTREQVDRFVSELPLSDKRAYHVLNIWTALGDGPPRGNLEYILNPEVHDGAPGRRVSTVSKHGRNYHSFLAGRVPYPCDEDARNAFGHIQWLIYSWYEGQRSMYQRPRPSNPPIPLLVGMEHKKVVDMGCGSGLWPLAIAEGYPGIKVVGVDISGGQVEPREHFDVTFLTHDTDLSPRGPLDIEGDWRRIEDDQSYIRFAHLGHCIADWPSVLEKTFYKLEPEKGYIEIMDFDWSMRTDAVHQLQPPSPALQFCSALDFAMHRRGTPLRLLDRTRQLESIGYDQIQHRIHRIPLFRGLTYDGMGRDRHDAAMSANLSYIITEFKLLENLSLSAFVEECGMTEQDARALIQQCEAFVCDDTNSTFVNL